MSRILHNKIRCGGVRVEGRALAFSVWTGRGMLRHGAPERRAVVLHAAPRRRYGMLVARAVRGVLKLRYLLLGGAVGGGVTLNKKYAEWKEGLPDMGWLDELIPSEERWQSFTDTLLQARDALASNIHIESGVWSDPRLREAGAGGAERLRDWLARRYDDAVAAAAANSDVAQDKAQLVQHSLQSKPTPGPRPAPDNNVDKKSSSLPEEVLGLQARYQRQLQQLEQENRQLRQQNMLLKQGRTAQAERTQLKKSLIDMYSTVLDELAGWDAGESDCLPRVVVVGDQSAGKTSVLEMIAQARIFPRGAGEMMTRAPVKVTLSEGPYHVAQFRDSPREFDLTKETELVELRKEVELRMRNSVRGGRTVSSDVISMSVKGPGLQRMVLVDLPGVISTQTVDMAADTRDSIRNMTKQYMNNPNAIILCIQDGSVDAERSNVTDLVSECDPSGKRTIFVLTKVDLAEENLANPNRIRRILEGKLFPMKALGYFAVVTGRSKKDDSIQDIHNYEEQFFRSSRLFKEGVVSASQVTTRNLSLAVAGCFWKMVRASVEQQADTFKAMRFNLETEWKNSFPRQRQLDRDELFERCRAALLDTAAELSSVAPAQWEAHISRELWESVRDKVIHHIYLPAAAFNDDDKFNTVVDIKLREWAESSLARESVSAGRAALGAELRALLARQRAHTHNDDVLDSLRAAAVDSALERHQWEERAAEVLRVLQLNALQDRCVSCRGDWDSAVKLMETALSHELETVTKQLEELAGSGWVTRWTRWQSRSAEQARRAAVVGELERSGAGRPRLAYDEVVAARDNLRRREIDVDNDYIRDTWTHLYLKKFLEGALGRARECRKSFYLYSQNNGDQKECCEVVMFWRVQQTLRTTANALRQQVTNREAGRLDKTLREVLDEIAGDPERQKSLLCGRRVELAEELKRVRKVQEKLEEFIEALNKEK